MEEERCYVSRGFMLGGSSELNAMIYLHGTKEDFNHWKEEGCEGWGYDDVLPYFKKSEDFVDKSRFNPEIHAEGGYLTVSPLETCDPAYEIISKAEKSLNLSMIHDFNRKEPPVVGYGNFDSTTRIGRRCSTLKAFLLPASNRANLYVAKNIFVTKIKIENKIAVGVEFLTSSNDHKSVLCTKEVILTAGAIKSPHILMLSGIGPKEHLKEFDINVVEDLPVGLNLQDHISFPGLVFSDRKSRSKEEIFKESMDLLKKETNLFSYNITTLGLSKLMTFYKTNNSQSQYPNLQIIKYRIPYNLSRNTHNKKNTLSNLFGYSDEIGKLFDDINMLSDNIFMTPILLHPLSKGRIMLKTCNAVDAPKIFADYLRHDEEIETLLEGIEFVVKLSKTKELMDAGIILEDIKLKQCKDFVWGTREYWLCSIRYLAAPFFHCVGTCKMGPEKDPKSVVCPKLKVRGINNLRVMDSSVMLKIVSVNTNAASIMIGEKGSDIIKQFYGKIP